MTMGTSDLDAVFELANNMRFAFQPVVNVKTGAPVGMEALARPTRSGLDELFRTAARQRKLAELDGELAVAAVSTAADHDLALPLHLNIFGGTITHEIQRLDNLHARLRAVGRQPYDVVLEVGPPFARLPPDALVDGVDKLRAMGYQIALDGIGQGDLPLTLIVDVAPRLLKVDGDVVRGLPDDPGRKAVLESVRHVCDATGTLVAVEGVEEPRQLQAVRHAGIRLVQGNLLAPAARRPPTASVSIPALDTELTDPYGLPVAPAAAGPRVTEFLSPATTLPSDVTADRVRGVFADHPGISGVVLVDEQNRPQWTIDRNRFLLAVTGPYGHALHAGRPAARLGDQPRVLTTSATAMEALNLFTGSEQGRMYDDAIVIDESGRCIGSVQASHLIRGMAELKVEEAASLNPLTRLPGSDAIARDVTRRIAAGDMFAVSWLDVDDFKTINDTVGFSAGDDLIRSIGRSLSDAAAELPSVQVGHLGGDDFLAVAGLDDLMALAERILDPLRHAGNHPVTLSLATLVCAQNTVAGYDEVSQRLAPLKNRAKSLRGSSWVLSRPGMDRVDVLRGSEVTPAAQPRPAFPTHDPDPGPDKPAR
jgi:diguanylate cyclase (GGDEF)-like protein